MAQALRRHDHFFLVAFGDQDHPRDAGRILAGFLTDPPRSPRQQLGTIPSELREPANGIRQRPLPLPSVASATLPET